MTNPTSCRRESAGRFAAAMPVVWGVALDRAGRVVVATLDGEVVALGPEG